MQYHRLESITVMAKNYYDILGVPRNADEKEIKAAYRRLARKFHPDVNPNDKTAEARFKEIGEAHSVLSDPEKRKLYDQFGGNWEAMQHAQTGGGGMDPNMGAHFDFGGGGFESIFEQLFSGGRKGPGFNFDDMMAGEPKDVEKAVEIPLEEIDSGTKRTLTYQTMDQVRMQGGISTVPTTKKVEITIPAGISDGKKLRAPGKGVAGINGKAGDLYVVVKWAKHSQFKPVEDHLEVEVDVPFTTAALGGEIRVPTLRGSLKMKIPEGAQSGQVFRLAGQGISRLNRGRGDLMAKIKITVPKKLSQVQRKMLEEFRKIEEIS
ncbi:MAG: DnaJ domain-containing protein [Armatimonadetes bacterium]|nr:DnaJ domain-containing protein [Armatimonadota bacterium]